MAESKIGEDISEEVKLGDVVQRYLQKDAFNALERIMCSYIIEAINGDPLQSIIFSMRAAMLLNDKQYEKLEIDTKKIESIYAVSQLIANPAKLTNNGEENYSINFNSLNWEEDIAPWIKMVEYNHWEEKQSEDEEEKTWQETFIETSKTLTETGYNHLKADFLRYAMPITQDTSRKLSQIISPTTFSETLSLFKQPIRRD